MVETFRGNLEEQLPVLAGLCLGLLAMAAVRWRRAGGRVLRQALAHDDPQVRRAAVLLMSTVGVRRFVRPLLRRARCETDEGVLVVLADAALSTPPKGKARGNLVDLRIWAQGFLWGQEAEAQVAKAAVLERMEAEGLDALAVVEGGPEMEVVTAASDDRPPTPVARPVWRAIPDQVDALLVVDAVARGARRPRARPTMSARPPGPAPAAGEAYAAILEATFDSLVAESRGSPRPEPSEVRRSG